MGSAVKLTYGELDAAISQFTEAIDSASHPTLKLQLRYQLANAFFKKKDAGGVRISKEKERSA